MKKIVLFILASAFSSFLNAQSDLFIKVKNLINETHPEIATDNKLIALNFWNVDNLESREANKSFEKAYKIYEYAKLKGGTRGIIVISVSKDNLTNLSSIAVNKDGIKKSISIKADDLKGIDAESFSNIVFDSNGTVVYKNLVSSKIGDSINQLITR